MKREYIEEIKIIEDCITIFAKSLNAKSKCQLVLTNKQQEKIRDCLVEYKKMLLDGNDSLLNKLFQECISILEQIGYQPDVKEIRLNNNLLKNYGCYLPNEKIIEINTVIYENAPEEQIKSIILHELVHNLVHSINRFANEELNGHGEAWQIIADDISEKADIFIHKNFPLKQKSRKKHSHTFRCRVCGRDKTVLSKYTEGEDVRAGRCEYCGAHDVEYLFNGHYAYGAKAMKKFIILNED